MLSNEISEIMDKITLYNFLDRSSFSKKNFLELGCDPLTECFLFRNGLSIEISRSHYLFCLGGVALKFGYETLSADKAASFISNLTEYYSPKEKQTNPNYCSCDSPVIQKTYLISSTFDLCTVCKKEHI